MPHVLCGVGVSVLAAARPRPPINTPLAARPPPLAHPCGRRGRAFFVGGVAGLLFLNSQFCCVKCRTRHAAPASTTVTHPTRAETAPWWQAWGWQKSIGSHARPWGQWGCPYGAFRVFPRFIPIAFLRVPAGTRSPTDLVLIKLHRADR